MRPNQGTQVRTPRRRRSMTRVVRLVPPYVSALVLVCGVAVGGWAESGSAARAEPVPTAADLTIKRVDGSNDKNLSHDDPEGFKGSANRMGDERQRVKAAFYQAQRDLKESRRDGGCRTYGT